MNGENYRSGSGQKTEKQRPLRTSEFESAYRRSEELPRRRIGSLVQSEELGSEEKSQQRKYQENAAVPRRTEAGQRKAAGTPRRRASAEHAADWKERLQERKKKRLRRIFIGLGSVIGVIYIAVAVYFGFHFYENTVIYGVDCSQKKVDQVKTEVAERLDDYKLTIQCREDKTETLSADQIGLEFLDNNSIDQILRAQHCYIWPIMMLLDHTPEVSVAFSYDEKKTEQAIYSLTCMNDLTATAPQDAYIGTTDTGIEVIPEVMGTTLDHSKTLEAIQKALDAGAENVSLEDAGCYVDPQIYSDDKELNEDAAAMNELASAYITLDFGSSQEIVNAPVIREWIAELSDGSYVIDDMKVTDYVEQLAAKYDTFGLPVEFYTSLGTTETLSGGDYGWCIDQSQTVIALLNALEEGYQGSMEPVYLFSAMSHENNGIGYTYVEICISQQRMWCYENGNLVVDTPVVTGNPNKGCATPSGGVWAIDAKKRDAILEGEGYEAPVDYWMPFNGDIGIHDLKERYHFGSTIYLTNGSHGCVNTPYEAVQKIFETVSIGTPVIVYE